MIPISLRGAQYSPKKSPQEIPSRNPISIVVDKLSRIFLFTGLMGLLVLLIATFIGLLPVEYVVRRSHCMGVLLIPIILYFL